MAHPENGRCGGRAEMLWQCQKDEGSPCPDLEILQGTLLHNYSKAGNHLKQVPIDRNSLQCARQLLRWPQRSPSPGNHTLCNLLPLSVGSASDTLLVNRSQQKWDVTSETGYRKCFGLLSSLTFLALLTGSFWWSQLLWGSQWRGPRGGNKEASSHEPVKKGGYGPTACDKLNPANTPWVNLKADPPK